MIHYHGADLDGKFCVKFFKKKDALISFPRRSNQVIITEICRSFVFDNGAFSLWKSGKKTEWDKFYVWVDEWKYHPRFQWFLIPDVINGSEQENDELIKQSPFPDYISVPVYHLGESFSRLNKLAERFPRIAIGSTQGYQLKTMRFYNEMRKIFNTICCKQGIPKTKIHGLRMLETEIVKSFPFSSCDSAGASIIAIYNSSWNYPYAPKNKASRATLYADKIEEIQSPSFYEFKPTQMELI